MNNYSRRRKDGIKYLQESSGNNQEQPLGGNDVRRKPRPINGRKKKTRLTQQCSAGAQIESRSWIKIRVFSTLSLLDCAKQRHFMTLWPFSRSTRRGHARAFVALWPYLATSWEATRCAQRKRRQQHGPPFHRESYNYLHRLRVSRRDCQIKYMYELVMQD